MVTETLLGHTLRAESLGALREGSKLPSERAIAGVWAEPADRTRSAGARPCRPGLIETCPTRGYVRHLGPVTWRARSSLLSPQQITPRHLVEARKMIECERASCARVGPGVTIWSHGTGARAVRPQHDLVARTRYDIAFT